MTRRNRYLLVVLVVSAVAWTTTGLWRGGRQTAERPPPPAMARTSEAGLRQPEQLLAGEAQPDAEAIAAAIECPDPSSDSGAAATGEQAGRQIQIDYRDRVHIVGRLAMSDDPDHRLAAVLMSDGHKRSPAGQVEALDGIIRDHPHHAMAFWNLVVTCDTALAHPICSDAALSARAEQIDSENSEVWALLAVRRERRGDAPGAAAAMQRAIGSASTSVYYAEHILLFERAYAAASDYAATQRVIQAIGDAAALPMQHLEVYKACGRIARQDMLWRRMCFDYGEMLESRASSLLSEQFGLSLQHKAASLDGDTDKVDELQQRMQNLRELTVVDDMDTIFDDQVNARYLEELSVHGERAAMAYLRDEIERRRALAERCR